MDRAGQRVDHVADGVGPGKIDRDAGAGVERELDGAERDAQPARPRRVGEPGVGRERRIEIDIARDLGRRGGKRLGVSERDRHRLGQTELGVEPAPLPLPQVRAVLLNERLHAGCRTAEDVPRHALSVHRVVDRRDHRADDRGLLLPLRRVAGRADLLERDVLGVQGRVARLAQDRVQHPQRRRRVLDVPLALRGTLDPIVQLRDGGGLDGVVARLVHAPPRRQFDLRAVEIEIRLGDVGQRQLLHQQVGNSRKTGGVDAHGSLVHSQSACRE